MFKTVRFAVLAGAAFMAAPALAQGSPVVGTWATAVETDFGKFEATMTVAETDSGYSVDFKDVPQAGGQGPGPMPSVVSDVVVDGPKFAFTRKLTTPQGEMTFAYSGAVEGDTLSGQVGSDFGQMKLAGTRQ
ncbi:MAG TPA: hypothetical protein VEB68_01215 [Croceibacterium sp.]|nr:hypothetical protein [Croceibacterium sp.]